MRYKTAKALTMIELLIAVAIVALLVSGIFLVSGRVREQAKIRQTESTLAMLDTALEQYYDFDKSYPPDVNYAKPGTPPTRSLPYALEPTSGLAVVNPATADYYDAQSIEVAYYYLNRVPQSRVVLNRLPESAVSAKAVKFEASGKPLPSRVFDPNVVVTINGKDVGLFRVVDAWNMPLRYIRRANDDKNFPRIESAGPDRKFGTADDIVNKKN